MASANRLFNERLIYLFLSLILLLERGISAAKPLVVGTIENEALLAREVGGDLIDVRWIVGADIDPQLAEPNEGFISVLKKADLLLVNGQGLEAGWLEPLLNEARNKKIMPGHENYILLSGGVNLLAYDAEDIRESRFREIMLAGGLNANLLNHHYWLDPENEIPMISTISRALIKIDPSHSQTYELSALKLIKKLEEKIKEWDASMVPFKGKKIIVYHRDWTYLAHRHGIEIVGYIEPRELNRPSRDQFKNLAVQFKNQNVSMVLMSEIERPPVVDIDSIRELGIKLHAHTLILPESMNPSENRGDIISYFGYVYKVLISLLK